MAAVLSFLKKALQQRTRGWSGVERRRGVLPREEDRKLDLLGRLRVLLKTQFL